METAIMTDHTDRIDEEPRQHHVCPWWVGYLIASPLRKLSENPDTILKPLVKPGMTAVDIGSAMGFFSLPMAKMVGAEGRVVCVDVQQRMLSTLKRRARRRGLDRIIEPRLCSQEELGLDDLASQADLVLAVHVVHETTYPRRFLSTCFTTLKPGGRLLLIEPNGHVSSSEFSATRRLALETGFVEESESEGKRSRSLVLVRPEGRPSES
jgi:2-polyprenyl-3-methyl-5-hydroxy-6-metoxy-1,4-benzoquinol methylase